MKGDLGYNRDKCLRGIDALLSKKSNFPHSLKITNNMLFKLDAGAAPHLAQNIIFIPTKIT